MEKPKGKVQRVKRVQFDFQPEAIDRLDDLVVETGAASRAEVVRRALALFDRVLEGERDGMKLLLRAPNGAEQQVVLLV
jgi:metal-responsive CopG/Arc/MetJ family transcriptional regulator